MIERSERNFSAYAPDLPGCAAAGTTPEEVICEMRTAITFHIESLREYREPVPVSRCSAAFAAA